MNQSPLFRGHHLPSVYRYRTLFEHLPPLPPAPRSSSRGRKPYPPDLLLRILIYRFLRQIPTLTELAFELENNPSLVDSLGLDPLQALPSVQRFSRFLRYTSNAHLQDVRLALVQALIAQGVICGKILAVDSCPVISQVRENNLKAGMHHRRFDKDRPPKGDLQAGLGVRIHYPQKRKTQLAFFWGYRNHTVTDVESELPLGEQTHPAHVSEVRIAQPLLRALQPLGLTPEFVTADSMYDVESILHFIVHQLHAQPIIPHNPRNEQYHHYSIRGGQIYCAANLPVASRGSTTHRRTGITYRQYGCPLYWRKDVQRKYLLCPIAHPKFFQQKGCTIVIRQTPSIRSQIPYQSKRFKNIYQKRIAAERSYSRLLTLTMQDPTVRGLKAVENHCTIAHIATLLIALTASRLDQHDKIRWIKSFVPKFLKT